MAPNAVKIAIRTTRMVDFLRRRKPRLGRDVVA
jgi:hypothetical protein